MAQPLQNGVADPLQLLTAALTVPNDSISQAERLSQLREVLETQTSTIPLIGAMLLQTVSSNVESLLRRWTLDLLQFALCGTALGHDVRTQFALQVVDPLSGLLSTANLSAIKTVIQCFSSMYPLIFRAACVNRALAQQWAVMNAAKIRILKLVESQSAPTGVRIAAIKFMQRALLVQTRVISDPRLQNMGDPNISMIPTDHPFLSLSTLEIEGTGMVEVIMTMLFTSKIVDILTAVLNCLDAIFKFRPSLSQIIVSSLGQWTPAALADRPPSCARSVERSVRVLMNHMLRSPYGAPFASQLTHALNVQAIRVEQALRDERARRLAQEASKKRALAAEDEQAAKRIKLEHTSSGPSASAGGELAAFDIRALPSPVVVELIIANLLAVPDQTLLAAIQAFRNDYTTSIAPVPPPLPVAPQPAAQEVAPASAVKSERVDASAEMDDDDEMEYEPDKLNDQLSLGDLSAGVGMDSADLDMNADEDTLLSLRLADFKLPLPQPLSNAARANAVQSSISRIWQAGQDGESVAGSSTVAIEIARPVSCLPSDEMWMLLLVRMVTRGDGSSVKEEESAEEKEEGNEKAIVTNGRQRNVRQKLCDYVMADFPNRLRFATVWLNEEWFNDKRQLEQDPDWPRSYHRWLRQIVNTYRSSINDGKDKSLSRFLLDVPEVPPDVLEVLRELCITEARMAVGFGALRELVMSRPPLRADALNILLDLTTHSVKITRAAAIITVKRWVPDVKPMDGYARDFAVQMLRRLESTGLQHRAENVKAPLDEDGVPNGHSTPKGDIVTSYVPAELSLPVEKSVVLQHVEMYFVLCLKAPELLDEIFLRYGQMDISVQVAIQDQITALVKSLGQGNGKLLTLLRTFPPGADSLVLRVITILTEKGRPSAPLVALVKSVVAERGLDARFIMPIIGEMDKADILRHLPRIIHMLNGKAAEKNLVRSVFASIITAPPQTFAVSSNLPRIRQSELLTPVELMILLHTAEPEIGQKQAIEAIGICFAMTEVYRSDVLAVVMTQMMDEPILPTLFMRTVILSIKTYQTLIGFVSTTILSRLITKKVWTMPKLWDGFVRCAKDIQPASFGALLQLPREQRKEVLEKEPDLRPTLREYVTKKAGNRARTSYPEIFGEEEAGSRGVTPTPIPIEA